VDLYVVELYLLRISNRILASLTDVLVVFSPLCYAMKIPGLSALQP